MPDADGQSPEDGYDEELVVSDRKHVTLLKIVFERRKKFAKYRMYLSVGDNGHCSLTYSVE